MIYPGRRTTEQAAAAQRQRREAKVRAHADQAQAERRDAEYCAESCAYASADDSANAVSFSTRAAVADEYAYSDEDEEDEVSVASSTSLGSAVGVTTDEFRMLKGEVLQQRVARSAAEKRATEAERKEKTQHYASLELKQHTKELETKLADQQAKHQNLKKIHRTLTKQLAEVTIPIGRAHLESALA